MATQLLPPNPNLEQLKRQAKEFLRAWKAEDVVARAEAKDFLPKHTGELKLAQAQLLIARRYAFRSWAQLKQFVESNATREILPTAVKLREAIDGNRLADLERMLDEQPELIDEHVKRSSGSYNNQRPLIYACQAGRPEVVRLLLERGADPSAEGYLAVARASMNDENLPVLRILFEHGIDPNVDVYTWGALLLYPCECLAPGVIRFLLEKGADPNRVSPAGGYQRTPLQMAMGTYGRSPRQAECVEALIAGGARFEDSALMDIHRNRLDSLRDRIAAAPDLVHCRFAEADYGETGARGLTTAGGTLLHVAVDQCKLDAARLLIECGADVNARATVDAARHGGQTPLFHAVSQYHNMGVPLVKLLLEHGADCAVTCTVRGDYDKPDEFVTGTALEYALRFPPGRAADDPTLALLREHSGKK